MDYVKRVEELLKMPQELCNMCGLCCKVAIYKGGMSVKEIFEIMKDTTQPTQADGAKDFLTIFEPMSKNEAHSYSPDFVDIVSSRFPEKKDILSYFKCRFLDYKSNKCLIHEDRPMLCRMYPIPHERTVYHKDCGFKDTGEKNWQEIVKLIDELQNISKQIEEQKSNIENAAINKSEETN